MGDEVHQLTGWQALGKKSQPPRGSPARAAGVRRALPSAGSVRSTTLGGGGRAAGPGEGGLGCCSGLLFHDCNCTEWSRSGALPPSSGPPGNLRHSHRFPHATWGRLRRPASLLPPTLPPCPAARHWPLGPGSKAWESRSWEEECKGGAPGASDPGAALGSGGPGGEGKVEGGQDGSGPGAGCQRGWEV